MRTEPICIYCTSPGPFTNEHPIPACFGEFKELPVLKDRLCRNCNNTVISRMEQQLCRCGPEGFLRSALGIRGRESHEPVNPFLRGSSGARAIDLVAPLPETLAGPQEDQIPILWEFNPGGETIREVRQIILRDEQGCWHQIRIPDWMTEPEQLREAIRELQLGSVEEARYFAQDEDIPWIESLVKGIGASTSAPQYGRPAVTEGANARVQVTDYYFRAVAKCAFHYLLVVRPELHGSEPCFAPIREFIIEGAGNWAEVVLQDRLPLIAYPSAKHRFSRWAHVIAAEWEQGTVEIRIQFFVGPVFEPMTYRVKLAEGVDELQDDGWCGHLLVYYPDRQQQGRYSGEAIRLLRRHGLLDPARIAYLP